MTFFSCWWLLLFYWLWWWTWPFFFMRNSFRIWSFWTLPMIFVVIDCLCHFIKLSSKIHFIKIEDDSFFIRKVRFWVLIWLYIVWTSQMLNYIIICSCDTIFTNWLHMLNWFNLWLWLNLMAWTLYRLFKLSATAIVNACRYLGVKFCFFFFIVDWLRLLMWLMHRIFSLDLFIYRLDNDWLMACLIELTALATARFNTLGTKLVFIHERIGSKSVYVSSFTSVCFWSELSCQLLVIEALFYSAAIGIRCSWGYSIMWGLALQLLNTGNGRYNGCQCPSWWIIITLIVNNLDNWP